MLDDIQLRDWVAAQLDQPVIAYVTNKGDPGFLMAGPSDELLMITIVQSSKTIIAKAGDGSD
jgi:hypothetical protein